MGATIVVSQDESAGVELVADASGVAAIASLADPKVELRVASTRGTVVHVVGATGLTPLSSCLRVKAPVFSAAAVRPVRGADDARTKDAFRRPSFQTLLES